MASSSTSSDPPANVDMVGAPAAVEWPDPTGGQPRSLPSRATLDLHLRPGTRTASLRLRVPIVLKGPGRKVTPLFFYIPPERIDALAFVGPEDTRAPEDVQKALLPGGRASSRTVSLRVRLTRPGDLVAPPVSPVLPKKKTHWDLFDALRSLAQALEFVVYWGLDKSPKSEESVRDVVCALSAGQFTASLLSHADISRLYEGKGGRLLTGSDLTNKPVFEPVEPAEPGPPAPPIEEAPTDADEPSITTTTSSSRKRRRRSSSSSSSSSGGGGGRSNPYIQEKNNINTPHPRRLGHGGTRAVEARMKGWVDESVAAPRAELDGYVADLVHEAEDRLVIH